MWNKTTGVKDALTTLWKAVAGWLFFTLLLIILIGGIGVSRFINLQRAIATLSAENKELEVLREIREDILSLENASRYSGKDEPEVFLRGVEKSAFTLNYQLDSLEKLIEDKALLLLTDSLHQLVKARTKQLATLVQLKLAQNEAAMPESLLAEVEHVLKGKIDTTIVIKLDNYIRKRPSSAVINAEDEVNIKEEQGKRNLLQQFKAFFGGKKKEAENEKKSEEIALTDSVLQFNPLPANSVEEVRLLLESARDYNRKLAWKVEGREIALRTSGEQLQDQLNRLTEALELRFLTEQQLRSNAAITQARKAGNILALISACGLLLGMTLMLLLKRLLRTSAQRQLLLEEEQKKVAQLIHGRQELLGSISHELRTPLQALTGFTNQLANVPADKQKRWIRLINQSAQQLSYLLSQLLQFNQFSNNSNQVKSEIFSLLAFLDELDEIYRPKLLEKKLSWEVIHHFESDLLVKSDPYRLRQLLYNLLDNALKYTERGGVRLEIIKHEHQLQFIISDTGKGIATEDLELMFEAYQQNQYNPDVLKGGVGLGLHLVKQLVELLGGQLEFESELEAGTRFYIHIPVEFNDASFQSSATLINDQPIPLRVLIVDDDVLNLELIESALGKQLSRLSLHKSSEETIENFKTNEFDVVITDYRLPGMNGAELVKMLRKKDPSCCFYLMTAAITEQESREFLDNNFSAVLEKPFELSNLTQILKEEQLAFYPDQWIDTSAILAFLDGNEKELITYLGKFKIEVAHQLGNIEQALKQGDFIKIHGCLHQLGSRLELINLPISRSVRVLESLALQGEWTWRESAQTKRILRICNSFLNKWT